jgi:hypothetical protein
MTFAIEPAAAAKTPDLMTDRRDIDMAGTVVAPRAAHRYVPENI